MEFQEVKEYFETYVKEYSPYKDDVVFNAIVEYLINYYLKNLYEEIPKQHKSLYEVNEIKDSVKNNLLVSLGVYKNVISKMSYFEKNIFLESLRGFYQFKGSVKFFKQVASSFNDNFNVYELYADYDEINQKWVLKPFPIYINPDVEINKQSLDYDEIYNEVPSLLVHSSTLTNKNTNREIVLPYKTNIILLDYLFVNEIYSLYQLIFATYLKDYGNNSITVYFQDDSFTVTLNFIVGLWYYLFSYVYNTNWSQINLVYCVLYDNLKNAYSLEEVDYLIKELEKLETTNEVTNFYQEYIVKIFASYHQGQDFTISDFKNSLQTKNLTVMNYIDNRIDTLTDQDLKDEVFAITNEIYDSLILSQFGDDSSGEFKRTYFNKFLSFLPQIIKQPKDTVSYLLLYNFKPYHVELIDQSREIIRSKNKFDSVLAEEQYNFLFELVKADYLSVNTDLFTFNILLEKIISNVSWDSNDFLYRKIKQEDLNVQEQLLKNFTNYQYNIIQLSDQFKSFYNTLNQSNLNILLEFLYRMIINSSHDYDLSETKKVIPRKISYELFSSKDNYNTNYQLNNFDSLNAIIRVIFNIFETQSDNLGYYLNEDILINFEKLKDEYLSLTDSIGKYSFSQNIYDNLSLLQDLIFNFNFSLENNYNLSDESFPIPRKISYELFSGKDNYNYSYQLNNFDSLNTIIKSVFDVFKMNSDNLNLEQNCKLNINSFINMNCYLADSNVLNTQMNNSDHNNMADNFNIIES